MLRFAEKLQRLGANLLRFQIHARGLHVRFTACTLRRGISAKSASLKRRDPRRLAREHHVCGRPPLKHLPHKNELTVFVAVRDAVADHSFLHRRRQLRREIAHLIGVRQQNEIRLRVFDRLAQRAAITVGRVFRKQVMLDKITSSS